jgi:hypothetical protein
VHGSNARNLYLSSTAKTFVFLIIAMSSLQQNWRKGQNKFCLEVSGVGTGGRNDPNNEYINKEKKKKRKRC